MLKDMEIEKFANILESSDVVACTTTGAAKYKLLLNSISSKIMVVEEAG